MTTTTTSKIAAIKTFLSGAATPKMGDLLRVLVDDAVVENAPPAAPAAPVVSEAERAAIETLDSVFGKVVPGDRRALSPIEVEMLMRERLALDAIESLTKKRKGAIRTTVFNHFDLGAAADAERDADGHALVAAEAPVPVLGRKFTREIAEGSRVLTTEALERLVDSGAISRDEFNAMTRQVRVVDEAKVLQFLRRQPEAAERIRGAITAGAKVARFCVRPFTG